MTHVDTVLGIANNAYLAIGIRVLWLSKLAAYVLGQLPQGTALLQLISWEVQWGQDLVGATLVAAHAQYHNLQGALVQITTDGTCLWRKKVLKDRKIKGK